MKRHDHKPPFKHELRTYPENQIRILLMMIVFALISVLHVCGRIRNVRWQDKVEAI